jgi:nitroimidazol reductase NimA-like FMN-containing flavoprotein (pyridoxamine 5'-phosphate oxidase superfamily)
MRQNPNVCFQVDITNNLDNWQSAVIYGQFEELKDEKAEKAREHLFSKVVPLMTGSMLR